VPLSDEAILGCFERVDTPWGTTWWSGRHGCFARVFTREGDAMFDAPGPTRLAWRQNGPVGLEHVVGVSVAELLAAVPVDDLHAGVRRFIARRVRHPNRYGLSGWLFPRPGDVVLGFCGRVVVNTGRAPPARYVSHSESPYKEEFAEERRAIDAAAAAGERELLRVLQVTPEATAAPEDDDDVPVRALLEDHFPDRVQAWRAALTACRARPVRALSDGWSDLVLEHERRMRTYRDVLSYHHLNALLDAGKAPERASDRSGPAMSAIFGTPMRALQGAPPDMAPGPMRESPSDDAPAVVARMQIARERPLSSWPTCEVFVWGAIRRERRRLVLERRGLPLPDGAVVRAEWNLEERLVRCAPLREARPFSNGSTLDPTHRHLVWLSQHAYGDFAAEWNHAFPGADLTQTITAVAGELHARGLFALAVWARSVLDEMSGDDCFAQWLKAWRELDAELDDNDLASLAARPPVFDPPTRERMREAQGLMDADMALLSAGPASAR
jgi:hypothetical protein